MRPSHSLANHHMKGIRNLPRPTAFPMNSESRIRLCRKRQSQTHALRGSPTCVESNRLLWYRTNLDVGERKHREFQLQPVRCAMQPSLYGLHEGKLRADVAEHRQPDCWMAYRGRFLKNS